jgi:putative ABC transport system permease protein
LEIIARLANLPGALPGACAQGLIWGIMAIGVYLTYRILDVADLTVDGSFGTGGAVCVMCLLSGMNVWAALAVAVVCLPALSPACCTPLWAFPPFWLAS